MADTIAGELTSGTLKLLVIRPVSRWKIWLSKLVAGYLASVVMVLYAVVCAYVALGATVGFGSWSAPETLSGITATSGMVMLHVSALEMASLFSVVSILMLISTFIDSGTVAGLISGALVVICTIAGGIIKLVVNLLPKTRWMEYAFFMHWQIAGHANGNFPLDNWSTMGSLAVLAAWSVLCIILSIIYFQGKDIKG
jgi:ABC-2 type transport system permease protein